MRETADNGLLVLEMLRHEGGPVVLDAGALNLLARTESWWDGVDRACVMTPHAGEFKRLTGEGVRSDDAERARKASAGAMKFGQVLLLKGARTVVAAPDGRLAVSTFANAALATAGSGDVLAGLIGALLAQGVEPFDAACLGVYLHGRAGERLSFRYGTAGLMASELPQEIALARHELDAHSS
jgi:NAD(P)H-hydrate epimerase